MGWRKKKKNHLKSFGWELGELGVSLPKSLSKSALFHPQHLYTSWGQLGELGEVGG
jgi:hypothetical protein